MTQPPAQIGVLLPEPLGEGSQSGLPPVQPPATPPGEQCRRMALQTNKRAGPPLSLRVRDRGEEARASLGARSVGPKPCSLPSLPELLSRWVAGPFWTSGSCSEGVT